MTRTVVAKGIVESSEEAGVWEGVYNPITHWRGKSAGPG